MVFKRGSGVFLKVCSFAIQSLIFNFWHIFFKNDVTKKNCYNQKVSENSHIKSQSWSLKMVLASSPRSVVLQFSLWFLIFYVFCSKMTKQKKKIIVIKKKFGEFSYKASNMDLKSGMGVFPKVCSFAFQFSILNFWRILFKNDVTKKVIFRHKKTF